MNSPTDTGNGGEYISDAINNRGVLVINGGTIENLSSATVASNGYPHAVDTYSGSRNTSVTINGGTIYCAEYSAIRMFCVSATNTADLVIKGGTIKGAIDMQNGTKVSALGTLTINDGTFETTANANNIRFANWNTGATEYGITAAIKGGSFNGGITTAYVPAAANWNKGIITGGTFSDASAFNYLGSNANVTIKLAEDVNVTEAITIPASATVALDLNGKKISQTSDTPVSMIINNGNLTIKDSGDSGKIAFTFSGEVDNDTSANAISNSGTLVIEDGEISNAGTGNQIGYAIDNYNGATLTVGGGKITVSGSSYYDGIRLMCGSNQTTVTVNNGEISTIWAQNPSTDKTKEVKGTVVINGGTIVTTYYENYTTVKVKTGVTTTVAAYGAGSDNTTTSVEDGYTIYSFVHSETNE